MIRRTTLHSTLLGLITLVAIAWVGFKTGRIITVRAQAQRTISVQPLILERWTITYRDDKPKIERKELHERRSDGAVCTKVLELDDHGAGETPTRHVILPEGREIIINDTALVRTSTRLSDIEVAKFKKRVAQLAQRDVLSCGSPLEIRADDVIIAGQNAQVWWREALSGPTMARTTFYRAPALGCSDLGWTREQRNADGTYSKKSEMVVKYLFTAEPPAADFAAAAHREVVPSEFDKVTSRGIAQMHERVATGWCKDHDCSSIERHMKQSAERDLEYRRRQ